MATFIIMAAFAPERNEFTPVEQQQISIETPNLFKHSAAFQVELGLLGPSEYAFPLPVGKASLANSGSELEITTTKGDAVKAMFGGKVRLSRSISGYGNVIVIRHANGLETVYANNAQNLVKSGQAVKAGQTIAIVGGKDGKYFCRFAVMVNGAKVNPAIILDPGSHRLYKETLLCELKNGRISVSVSGKKAAPKAEGISLDPNNAPDVFGSSGVFKLNLDDISKAHWAYPLPGAKLISPYGGRRRHGGIDLKTKPKDEIVAAFDGIVTRSGRYYGYGNCIVLKHAYGFETLYGHQYKNLVKVGQHVKAGQVIGLTGRTGRATTEHLHFEVHYRGRNLNPTLVFNCTSRSLQPATLTLYKSGKLVSKKH